jgi:hypothetical protein
MWIGFSIARINSESEKVVVPDHYCSQSKDDSSQELNKPLENDWRYIDQSFEEIAQRKFCAKAFMTEYILF